MTAKFMGTTTFSRRGFLPIAGAALLLLDSKEMFMPQASASQTDNKSIVRESFERWANGTGGPFELLAPDAEWTIVGSSPLSKTYPNKQAFIDEVIAPFNARMSKPLVPSIRGL